MSTAPVAVRTPPVQSRVGRLTDDDDGLHGRGGEVGAGVAGRLGVVREVVWAVGKCARVCVL